MSVFKGKLVIKQFWGTMFSERPESSCESKCCVRFCTRQHSWDDEALLRPQFPAKRFFGNNDPAFIASRQVQEQ